MAWKELFLFNINSCSLSTTYRLQNASYNDGGKQSACRLLRSFIHSFVRSFSFLFLFCSVHLTYFSVMLINVFMPSLSLSLSLSRARARARARTRVFVVMLIILSYFFLSLTHLPSCAFACSFIDLFILMIQQIIQMCIYSSKKLFMCSFDTPIHSSVHPTDRRPYI